MVNSTFGEKGGGISCLTLRTYLSGETKDLLPKTKKKLGPKEQRMKHQLSLAFGPSVQNISVVSEQFSRIFAFLVS